MKHAAAFLTILFTLTACEPEFKNDPAEDFQLCRNRVYSVGFNSAKYGTCAEEKERVMRDQSNSLQSKQCYLDQNWYRMAAWEQCDHQCNSDKLECLDRLCKETSDFFEEIYTTNNSAVPCADEQVSCSIRCAEATYPNSPPKE